MLTNAWIPRFIRPVTERMPYSIYYNICRYLDEKEIVAEKRDTFNASQATCHSDSLTVVFVLGESLRYDHLQLNGIRTQYNSTFG